jgi:hypothetical protein
VVKLSDRIGGSFDESMAHDTPPEAGDDQDDNGDKGGGVRPSVTFAEPAITRLAKTRASIYAQAFSTQREVLNPGRRRTQIIDSHEMSM